MIHLHKYSINKNVHYYFYSNSVYTTIHKTNLNAVPTHFNVRLDFSCMSPLTSTNIIASAPTIKLIKQTYPELYI